jgi:hypothetical protein
MNLVTLKHITYRLQAFGNKVRFCIEEMDEKFRAYETRHKFICPEFTAHSGVIIASTHHPKLFAEGAVTLRGSSRPDDKLEVVLDFYSHQTAQVFVDLINEALTEWDETWDGWKR